MSALIEILAEWLIEGVFYGLGRGVRRTCGLQPTESGNIELMIGISIVVSIIGAIVVWRLL